MARIKSAEFWETVNAETGRSVIVLIELEYDTDTWIYLAGSKESGEVKFGDKTYLPFPFNISNLQENREGSLDTMTITAQNATRYLGGLVEQYNAFRGKRIIVKIVPIEMLSEGDDKTTHIQAIFMVNSCSLAGTNIEIHCVTAFDLLHVNLPNRRFSRNYCPWIFKGDICQYAGGETFCGKSFEWCRGFGNQERFGGFPGVPGKQIFQR